MYDFMSAHYKRCQRKCSIAALMLTSVLGHLVKTAHGDKKLLGKLAALLSSLRPLPNNEYNVHTFVS